MYNCIIIFDVRLLIQMVKTCNFIRYCLVLFSSSCTIWHISKVWDFPRSLTNKNILQYFWTFDSLMGGNGICSFHLLFSYYEWCWTYFHLHFSVKSIYISLVHFSIGLLEFFLSVLDNYLFIVCFRDTNPCQSYMLQMFFYLSFVFFSWLMIYFWQSI